MAVLKLPARSAVSQPQGSYEVDYSNSITERLLETVIPRTRVTAKQRLGTGLNGSLLKVASSKLGPVLTCTAFDNSGASVISFPGGWAPNPPFTAHTLFYQGIDSAIQNNVGMAYAGNSGGWLFLMVSRQVKASVTWPGGGAGVTVSSATLPLNTPTLATIVVRPTTFDLYINGELAVANTAHSGVGIPGMHSIPFFDGNTRYGNLSGVYNLSVWGRCLRPEEIRSLWFNPWQIFKSPAKYLDIQPRQFFAPVQSKILGTSTGAPATAASIGRSSGGFTCTSQPQGPARIDWGNSITRGLVFASNPISAFESVKGGALSGVSPRMPTVTGIYVGGVASSQTGIGMGPVATSSTWTAFIDIETRANPNGYGGRFWRPTGVDDGQHALAVGGTTGSKVIVVAVNYATIISVPLNDNRRNRCVVKHGSADHAIWVDGVSRGTSSNASTWSIGINSTNALVSDAIGLQAIWDRALSDAEIKSLSANPWQIFAPQQRNIWVPYP